MPRVGLRRRDASPIVRGGSRVVPARQMATVGTIVAIVFLRAKPFPRSGGLGGAARCASTAAPIRTPELRHRCWVGRCPRRQPRAGVGHRRCAAVPIPGYGVSAPCGVLLVRQCSGLVLQTNLCLTPHIRPGCSHREQFLFSASRCPTSCSRSSTEIPLHPRTAYPVLSRCSVPNRESPSRLTATSEPPHGISRWGSFSCCRYIWRSCHIGFSPLSCYFRTGHRNQIGGHFVGVVVRNLSIPVPSESPAAPLTTSVAARPQPALATPCGPSAIASGRCGALPSSPPRTASTPPTRDSWSRRWASGGRAHRCRDCLPTTSAQPRRLSCAVGRVL